MDAKTGNDAAGTNRPHLVVLQGPGLGDFFEITDDELVLGSDPFRADIVVPRCRSTLRPSSCACRQRFALKGSLSAVGCGVGGAGFLFG